MGSGDMLGQWLTRNSHMAVEIRIIIDQIAKRWKTKSTSESLSSPSSSCTNACRSEEFMLSDFLQGINGSDPQEQTNGKVKHAQLGD